MPRGLLSTILLLLIIAITTRKSDGQEKKLWCIANEHAQVEDLQNALDYACGTGGADCTAIQPTQPCFIPNDVIDHASYAFNSYYQMFKNQGLGASCYFGGVAYLTGLDPNHDDCHFEFTP